jgi:UDP-N-acetylglucosamine 2-epimerase (non-hydrolysing)
MSPVIRALKRAGQPFFVIHTGQHYSYEMDGAIFENLALEEPAYNLRAGSGSHAEETGRMLMGIEKILLERNASGVLVEGDTNTVLAGALAAAKLGVRVGHVEAGLRSGDRSMPEELNRILTDHLSDVLFAPTQASKENLIRESVP